MSVNEQFITYSDYFAFAAEAGLERARALFPAINTSTLVASATVSIPTNFDIATKNLSQALDAAYEFIWHDGQALSSIQAAFRGLETYILKKSGRSVDSFLSKQGIRVERLYVTLHNIVGENDVSTSHIKS